MVSQESDWIEWTGGECPVAGGSIVEVRYAREVDSAKGCRIDWPVAARELAWYYDGEDDDIIAYRVVSAA